MASLSSSASERRPHVLIGVSGSVATIKLPEICSKLRQFAEVSTSPALCECVHHGSHSYHDVCTQIKVIATPHSLAFIQPAAATSAAVDQAGAASFSLKRARHSATADTEHSQSVSLVDSNGVAVTLHTDADEWSMWKQRGDPVLHIEVIHSRCWAGSASSTAKLTDDWLCMSLVTAAQMGRCLRNCSIIRQHTG